MAAPARREAERRKRGRKEKERGKQRERKRKERERFAAPNEGQWGTHAGWPTHSATQRMREKEEGQWLALVSGWWKCQGRF